MCDNSSKGVLNTYYWQYGLKMSHSWRPHLGYKFTLRLRRKDLGIEGCPYIELVGQASAGRVA